MNKFKKLYTVITAILIMTSATGCQTNESSSKTDDNSTAELSSSTVNLSETQEINLSYTSCFDEDDLNTNLDNPSAQILLNGNTIEINGKGAEFADGKISIVSGGTYVFSGTLDDGQIYINTKEKVHIGLNGINISCSNSSPIFIEDSDNAVITVCDGTENTLSDTENYTFENEQDNEPDAVIYSKDDLSVNGSGTLNLQANYNEGLASKNDLKISGIKLNITSVGNAVKGKDSLAVKDACITANSQSDGLKSSNTEETDKGYIVLESGEFNITTEQDAFQAESDLIVYDGTFNIKTGEGSSSESAKELQQSGGRDKAFMMEGNSNKSEESQKGFKAGKNLIIHNGNITADCYDDTIHSNNDTEINGGTLTLSSADDGIHASNSVNINNGDINILNSYEGIEGTVINVNDGKINLRASDDGFNASEGSSTSDTETTENNAQQKMFGGGFGDVSENCILNINGGYVYVNADGDGLDSNGTININDGIILVDGPTNDGNGALDTGVDINVNGGTLIAAGSSGMAEIPSDTSKQNSIAVSFDKSQDAKNIICIKDENEKNIIAYSPAKTYSSVIISTPEIISDKQYSIYSGGKYSGTETDGLYSDGEYSDGTLIENISVNSVITQAGTGSLGMMGMGHGSKMSGEKMELPTNENGEVDMEMPEGFENMTPPDDSKGGRGNFNKELPTNENGEIDMEMPEGFENMTPPDDFRGGRGEFNKEMPTNENGEIDMEMPKGFGEEMNPGQ